MKNKNYFYLAIAVFIIALVWLFSYAQAGAVAVDKVTWCHTEPNGNQQTLELPQAALEQAGHVDANGNPLHAGDHAGACVEVTPTGEPSITPEVTPDPTATPSATPSATPTETPNTGGPGDGLSDGKSDGRSSCPECTEAPKVSVPQGAPNAGRG